MDGDLNMTDAYQSLLTTLRAQSGASASTASRMADQRRRKKRKLAPETTWPVGKPDVQHETPAQTGEQAVVQLDSSIVAAAEELPMKDSLAEHFERKLTDAEVEALDAAKMLSYHADPSPAFAAAWPDGTWHTSGQQTTDVVSKKVRSALAAYGIKLRLISLWQEAHKGSLLPTASSFASGQQAAFFALCNSYKDVLLPMRPYPTSAAAADELLDAALLHALNHVTKCGAAIKASNDALKADPEAEAPRDQGFTRPKVLLLLPFRNAALRAVKRLVELAQKETRTDSVQNKARFLEDFGAEDDDEEVGRQGKARSQPAEHAALFEGNTDDHFRLGIKLTKGSVRLYADFYQSDILVASPIGLATLLAEGEGEEKTDGDRDFLSSVEIVIADRADVFLMQNWAHVVSVFEALNCTPTEPRGADVMRVRELYLAGRGRYYRQTILLSSFLAPEMNALFARSCRNHAGCARFAPLHKGLLSRVREGVQQTFQRFAVSSTASEADARFEHFCRAVWPRVKETSATGQLVFVPSYFDYVRLRAFLEEQGADFLGLSEYTDGSEAARGRSSFADGRTKILLYTERAHFYHRGRTKGVQDLWVYQLPEHAHFYIELMSTMTAADAQHATVKVLFSKFDALRLERTIGTSRSAKMLHGKSMVFMFC